MAYYTTMLDHIYIQVYFYCLRNFFSGITLTFIMLFLIFESYRKITPRQDMASKIFTSSSCSLSSVKENEVYLCAIVNIDIFRFYPSNEHFIFQKNQEQCRKDDNIILRFSKVLARYKGIFCKYFLISLLKC